MTLTSSPIIETARLTLTPPQLDDARRIARFLNDFDVAGNLARVPYPYRLDDARAWLRTRQQSYPPGETGLGIYLNGEGLVGQVGFHISDDGEPIIGYWLGKPFWNQGIMTEAVTASLDWYFANAEASRIVSGVFYFNAPSLAVQHKLGFTTTGESMIMCLARGRQVRHIDTQLTRAVWAQRQAS